MQATPHAAARTRMLARTEHTLAVERQGFPHLADPETGAWTTSPNGDWTGGHFVGQLWLAARHGERYHRAAQHYSAQLDGREDSPTIFRGFLFYYGAAVGGLLLDDATAWERATRGAKSLAADYNPHAGIIPLGTAAEESSDTGDTETSIDAVGAVSALLSIVANRTGDATMRDIAASHARRHIEICLRPDGSIAQSGTIDPHSRTIARRYSHKGYSSTSTWARAQAWAILAFTLSARWLPGNPDFLDAAIRAADWWEAHIPSDLVAFWDFNDAAIPATNRDTSATAIAAAALCKLAALVPEGERYRELAQRTADALTTDYLRPVPGLPTEIGVLGSGCYNKPINLAPNNELIWGNYYLDEALAVLDNDLDPLTV